MASDIPKSRFSWFSIIYGGMVCIAGVLGNKQVSLGPLAVEAGIFPVSFIGHRLELSSGFAWKGRCRPPGEIWGLFP